MQRKTKHYNFQVPFISISQINTNKFRHHSFSFLFKKKKMRLFSRKSNSRSTYSVHADRKPGFFGQSERTQIYNSCLITIYYIY